MEKIGIIQLNLMNELYINDYLENYLFFSMTYKKLQGRDKRRFGNQEFTFVNAMC